MKLNDSQTQIYQKPFIAFAESLFSRFIDELPPFYGSCLRTIPFAYIYLWFSYRRIDKNAARQIMKAWCENKLCTRVLYTGIKFEAIK